MKPYVFWSARWGKVRCPSHCPCRRGGGCARTGRVTVRAPINTLSQSRNYPEGGRTAWIVGPARGTVGMSELPRLRRGEPPYSPPPDVPLLQIPHREPHHPDLLAPPEKPRGRGNFWILRTALRWARTDARRHLQHSEMQRECCDSTVRKLTRCTPPRQQKKRLSVNEFFTSRASASRGKHHHPATTE